MEQLAASQTNSGAEIQRLIANFKKDSSTRKTTEEYFNARLENLEAIWKAFDETDSKIRDLPYLDKNDEYFTSNFYSGIKDLYEGFKATLIKGRNALSQELQKRQAAQGNQPPQGTQSPQNSNLHAQRPTEQQPTIMGLIRRQTALKTSLKRLLQGNSFDEAPEQSLAAISRLWQNIEDLNLNIWELCENPDNEGYDCEDYLSLQNMVITKSAHISTLSTCPPAQPIRAESDTSGLTNNLHLPKISIPKFDGEYLKWQPFSDIFSKMIHEQKIPAIQKMWYLKANVSGEAERLIRHLELTENNYTTAWSTLRERYDNKRVLVSAILHKLISWESLKAEAKSIRDFHDVINESLSALENIGTSTTNWDPILLYLLIKKLDRQTHIIYEQSVQNPKELQTISHFLKVLQTRFQALEAVGGKENAVGNKERTKQVSTATTSKPSGCPLCKGSHPIFYCKQFLAMDSADRLRWVQGHKLCVNCLKPDHRSKDCTSRSCSKCSKKHNSLLHLKNSSNSENNQTSPTDIRSRESTESPSTTSSTVASANAHRGSVLLGTAMIKITANNGRSGEFRALLDSGSQINIVTERLIRKLSIQPKQTVLSIEGIGGRSKQATQRVNVNFQSTTCKFSSRLEAYVLPNIIPPQPSSAFNIESWSIPDNVSLADPQFNRTAKIDVLLGAEFYFQLLLSEELKLADNLPILRNTKLGWIASGILCDSSAHEAVCAVFSNDDLSTGELVEKFWKIEDISSKTNFTVSEQACETHFNQTTTRDRNGRFVVRLPLSEDAASLGESRSTTCSRFLALERRLQGDINLQRQYQEFMKSYEDLGHMTEVDPAKINGHHYYIPHHCVLRPESTTTKLRVVFDASAKTSSGRSLNDILLTGPTIQGDLFGMLLRFRLPRFVFTTDIEKMYRQILVDDRDRNLQLILWRDSPSQPLRHYQLNTVTYGTSAAPYLSTKCLQKLAATRTEKYPLGAAVLAQDFYVDDGISGSDILVTALEMQNQLTNLLKEAGFKLRKWCANHRQLLKDIPQEDQEVNLDFENASIKALGLVWSPSSDQFCLKTSLQPITNFTKRSVISDVARIYDPLGIAGPVVVAAKIFIQQLWKLQLSWDDELPDSLASEWLDFRMALNTLHNTRIQRHVFDGQTSLHTQIHVFVDASEKAYGAAVYIRSNLKNGRTIVHLLCAKSRIAPLQNLSLPRLELCAALLGAELATKVRKELRYEDSQIFYWSDSEIVLYWINSASSSLRTFVANRISKIQDLTVNSQWRHVKSKDNPADLISRGMTPEKLPKSTLWFYGPLFLHGNESIWPAPFKGSAENATSLEFKQKGPASATATTGDLNDIIYTINHRNSFVCLQRTTAYVLRFIRLIKREASTHEGTSLTPTELDDALHVIVRTLQHSDFSEEIKTLRNAKPVHNSSALSNSSPFLDSKGIIRAGGRLESSDLPYDTKHPMILPYNDPIVRLLLVMLHINNHHCGPQQLTYTARQKFWIIKAKTMARNVVHNCIRCTKAKPHMLQQIMGNLPKDRITPSRPFIKTGVDYCGPFWVHYKLRGKRPHKVYIAVFCCFATKAVHMEVVTDLTTDAFIGALKRFVSRRGRCQTIYSDNATNFVGAKNQLEEIERAIFTKESQEKISQECAKGGINFKFIPPRAPHFGGLWEAAVKSAKHLLFRTVSTASLTHEELETVVIEVEAILNSRPLTPLSSNPNDLMALTPGHFLIGEPLTTQIDARAQQTSTSLATRWKLVSELKHRFWNRWSQEYLTELQQRSKWKTPSANISPGQLVIIKEDNTPVMQWPLGRIIKTYKGSDEIIRVVDVKTSSGTVKRAIHHLALLPIETPEEGTEPPTPKHPEEQEPTPAKRRKTLSSSLLCTTLLTLLLIPAVIGTPIRRQPFGKHPGLYFEGIGTARIITAEWKLMVYYNLVPFRTEIETFAAGVNLFSNLCQSSPQLTICNEFVSRLRQIQSDLIQERDIISRRPRRGALNIIGNIASSLFGVLDSDYATKMDNTIKEAEDDRQLLSTLLHNQTSIIDSTINIIKENESSLQTSLSEIKEKIRIMQNAVIDEQKTTHLLILLASELILAATRLQNIETEIVDVLTDSHQGKISPSLLAPNQLQKEINVIRAHLPLSRVLPIDENNLILFYKILRAKAAVTKDKVIFEIKVPLVDQQPLELLKIFGIPTNHNGTLVTILPATPYLGITPHRDEFIPISNEDINNCLKLNNDVFLCDNKQAVFAKGSTTAECEVSLFNHKPTSSCRFGTFSESTVWQQTYHKNQWIYATINDTELTAVCETETVEITLTGSGILHIQPNCTIKTSEITIRGHYDASSHIQISYPRSHNINQPTNASKVPDMFKSTKQILTSHSEKLNDLQTQLHKADLTLLHTAAHQNNYHHPAISYAALVISSLLLLSYLARKFIRRRNDQSESLPLPTPTPRQTTSQRYVIESQEG